MPNVSTKKNGSAADDGKRHNSTESIKSNTFSKIAERKPIQEDAVEKEMGDTSCKMKNSVSDAKNEDEDDDLFDIRVPSGMIVLEDVDDGEILAGSESISIRPATSVQHKPGENEEVDDRAILDCWNLTIASHVAATDIHPNVKVTNEVSPSLPSQSLPFNKNEYIWQAKDSAAPSSTEGTDVDMLKNWKPKALALPPWAINPFEMSFIVNQAKEKKTVAKC